MTPALTSCSLNLPMSSRSFVSGITPASESFVALTITMNRIGFSSTQTSNEERRDRHGSGASVAAGLYLERRRLDGFKASARRRSRPLGERAAVGEQDRDKQTTRRTVAQRATVTFTSSPVFTVVDFHPALTRYAGEVISTFHVSVPPLPSGTSTSIHECGLVHENCLMVPTSSTDLVRSMPADE